MNDEFNTGWYDGIDACLQNLPCEWDGEGSCPYGDGYWGGYCWALNFYVDGQWL